MKIILSGLSFLNFRKRKIEKFLYKNKIKYLETIPKFLFKSKKIRLLYLQSTFFNFKSKNISDHIAHFIKISNLCQYYGINNINIGSYPLRKLRNNKKSNILINSNFIREICQTAKNNNQIISIEPIGKKYGNYFLSNHFDIVKFIKKEKIKNLRLLFDTGNFKKKSEYRKNFIKYKKFIHHIHISNYNLEELNLNFIKDRIVFFKKNKFRKTITIEWLNKKNKIKEIKNLISFLNNEFSFNRT